MENIIISKINGKEDIPLDLLLLADPSEEAINYYLEKGYCYVAYSGIDLVGVYVLLPTRPFTIELINIAITEDYQGKGYGKQMLQHAIDISRGSGYKTLEVGTGNSSINQLAFYQKSGFVITSIDFDFFKRNYKDSIIENGIECRHMIRLSMLL